MRYSIKTITALFGQMFRHDPFLLTGKKPEGNTVLCIVTSSERKFPYPNAVYSAQRYGVATYGEIPELLRYGVEENVIPEGEIIIDW